ncbi:AraC family transcriptional regulator [Cellvibrio sp. BR]|uniref:helix-turn-helix domain-containing protein n=1 Tax=Cellvibrio sp. BR TaxID=1134474 RepID=UPI0012F4EDF1|nr:AraC family transcriptional regulator [Cellvibrio sp. BR]
MSTNIMIDIPIDTILFVLLPILSAQLILVVLVYFSLVSRRVLSGYGFHVCYLVCYVIYLLGKALQNFAEADSQLGILFFRVLVLFALGIPSMVIATALQTGTHVTRRCQGLLYSLGLLASGGYIVIMDATTGQLLVPDGFSALLPFTPSVKLGEWSLTFYLLLALIAPCCYLLYQQLQGRRSPVALSFLAGSISFGLFHGATTLFQQSYWLLYLGAIVTTCCWCWAVYQDIRYTKGRAELLQEELQLLIGSGKNASKQDIDILLGQLEASTRGNLALYKLKVRETIDRLTGLGIEAGGNLDNLLARNVERNQALENSGDLLAVRAIIADEALAFSKLITQLPKEQEHSIAARAQAFISQHYRDEIDVASIAQEFNVSQSYLMRVFKKNTGQTLNQYLVSTRINEAKKLLLVQSVTTTAFDVGFNSANYFSTVFKKETGQAPVDFQKNHQSP